MDIHTIPIAPHKNTVVRLFFKPQQNKIVILSLMLIIAGGSILFRELQHPSRAGFIGYILVVFGIIYPFLVWWRYQRFVSHPMNKMMLEPMTYHLTDDTIRAELNDGSLSILPWHRILKVMYFDETFLLYVSQGSIFSLSAAVFPSPEEFEEFRKFLDSKALYSYDRKG